MATTEMPAMLDQFTTHLTPAAQAAAAKVQRNRLEGRLCVVGGASGIVGSGICRQLLMEGAKVVALLRREESREGLMKECAGAPVEHLFPAVVADASKEDEVKALVDGVVREHGQVDHAVSCFGAWWQGGLLTEQSYAEFSKVIANFAGSHFVFAKSVLPVMKRNEQSSMLFITGGVGKRVLSADSGLATVGGAAVYGVVRAAQAEFAEGPPAVHEMRIYALVTRHGEVPKVESSIVRGLRAHSNRKIGNLAVEELLAGAGNSLLEVTSERLDGVMLMVGD